MFLHSKEHLANYHLQSLFVVQVELAEAFAKVMALAEERCFEEALEFIEEATQV